MARRNTTSGKQAETGSEAPSVIEQAQEATEQVTGQVQETAVRLGDTLREQAVSQLSERKEMLAGGLETMSLALRTAANEVGRRDNPLVARTIESAAGRLETFSGSLRENDVDALTAKVEQVGRQRPTLFLSGALGVGLLAARLFKTSSRKQAERDRERARREEERQRHLRAEEEHQRAAAARSERKQGGSASDVEAASGAVGSGGDLADELGTAYGGGELAPGSAPDDALAGVPLAPGYADEALGAVDEDALTAALLDPTGLGTGSADAPYDVGVEVLGTTDPGRERS